MEIHKPWMVSGPHILTKPNWDYDGKGWHIVRKLAGNNSAHEWVTERGLVKYFKTEESAKARCRSLNR